MYKNYYKTTPTDFRYITCNAKTRDEIIAKALARTYQHRRYLPSEIAMASEVNLVDLLIFYDERLLSYSQLSGIFSLTTNPSTIIYAEGSYNTITGYFSKPIDAVKYILKLDFPTAVYLILSFISCDDYISINEYRKRKYQNSNIHNIADLFNLNPEFDNDNMLLGTNQDRHYALDTIYGILCSRYNISRNVIASLIRSNRLFLNYKKDICFAEYDKESTDKIICITQYTSASNYYDFTFHRTKYNSSFTLKNYIDDFDSEACKTVLFFQNIMEMLSYQSLIDLGILKDHSPNTAVLSLNSTKDYTLSTFLKENAKVEKIVACLPNNTKNISFLDNLNYIKVKVENNQKILRDYTKNDGGNLCETWHEMLKKELHRLSSPQAVNLYYTISNKNENIGTNSNNSADDGEIKCDEANSK